MIRLALLSVLILPLLFACNQPDQQVSEEHRERANQLIEAAMSDDSMVWERLAHLVDYYPHRLSGSQMLEDAIDWTVEQMQQDGFDDVRTQEVQVPHWVRGDEYATLKTPIQKDMPMLGLGSSVGTGPDGITAEVMVVRDFDELDARSEEAEGKIVLFNFEYETYGQAVQYRVRGADAAAQYGAVAAIIRSVTDYSMQTPHTGNMRYSGEYPKIPIAAITVEDANLIHRFIDRGESVEVELYMEAETLPDATSRNIIAEIHGSEKPEEIIVIGGHIDSWDTGQGAMDDAGGCLVTWEALRIMAQQDRRPKRTIRLVLWTNEENGVMGGRAYRDKVEESGEIDNHVLAFEVDFGVFEPLGYGFTGPESAMPTLKKIASLMEPVANMHVREGSSGTVDIGPLNRRGVPIMGLDVDVERYFWYHHSPADTIDVLDEEEVKKCTASVAVMAWMVADMESFIGGD